MWIAIIIAALVVLLALFMASRGRYYNRLFSAESFREFHEALSRAMATAQRKEPGQPPSPEDGTGFLTRPGLAAGVTCRKEGDGLTLHISLSQPGQITTHALCSRYGFFVIAMIGDLKATLTPYFTDSGVHHLVFQLLSATIHPKGFDVSYTHYLRDYKPIPFRHESQLAERAAP